ncbi:M15 family metallopeptidase [Saxibacter everestensis]|uniref:M15 family metallopeptidase n=1 Tax=Saxibacter everestensis TaxID=2909229 RepID=A0ABY8QNF5_9MICO|nr:M15 family metallopeptidase [Brevibacteriaceae bacterium ZFBP1038]
MGSHRAESSPIRRRDQRLASQSPVKRAATRAQRKVVSPLLAQRGKTINGEAHTLAGSEDTATLSTSVANPSESSAGAGPIPARQVSDRGLADSRRRKSARGKAVALSSLTGLTVAGSALAVFLVSGAFSSPDAQAETPTIAQQDASTVLSAEAVNGTPETVPEDIVSGNSDTSRQKENAASGVEKRSKADAASRSITRTVLPGCDGKKPAGSFENGKLPDSVLCKVGIADHKLRADAAVSFAKMNAAFKAETGDDMVLTDTYRSYESQVSVASRKPGLAATPGKSQHGLGLAIDFGGGAATASGVQYNWLVQHGAEYGWENPDWAKTSKYEPWHWEYTPGGGRD